MRSAERFGGGQQQGWGEVSGELLMRLAENLSESLVEAQVIG